MHRPGFGPGPAFLSRFLSLRISRKPHKGLKFSGKRVDMYG